MPRSARATTARRGAGYRGQMKFGRYELLERLGEGGMGVVSLACERAAPGGDRFVALKIVHPDRSSNPRFIDLLEHEASIIARLSHPNVVRIHRLGEIDGRYFIAMEMVNGATLRELLEAAGGRPLPVGACVAAVVQVCYGAHAAHELRDDNGKPLHLVHRDITPHNVMVDENGAVKLLDFGVAADDSFDDPTGVVMGKPAYLSPEQANGSAVDRRSDVFAIGALLWELFAGRRRILSDRPRAAIAAIAGGASPDILDVREDLAPIFVDALKRALAFHADDRFESAWELAKALEHGARLTSTDITASVLAETMRTFAGARLAARAQRTLRAIERTLMTPPSSGAGGGDDETVLDPAPPPPRPRPGAAVVPLDFNLPAVARGDNYELSADPHIAVCRVWARPDKSRDDGARSAQELVERVEALLKTESRRGFVLDVREARMVLGAKTFDVLERMFAAAEQRGVRIAALVSADPLQRLDYSELVARSAPRCGRVVADVDEARRFVR